MLKRVIAMVLVSITVLGAATYVAPTTQVFAAAPKVTK